MTYRARRDGKTARVPYIVPWLLGTVSLSIVLFLWTLNWVIHDTDLYSDILEDFHGQDNPGKLDSVICDTNRNRSFSHSKQNFVRMNKQRCDQTKNLISIWDEKYECEWSSWWNNYVENSSNTTIISKNMFCWTWKLCVASFSTSSRSWVSSSLIRISSEIEIEKTSYV